VGCVALKSLDDGDSKRAEIKSMRSAEQFRRCGVGARLLRHVIDEAVQRGVSEMLLETGSFDFFAPARALYRKFGFEECGAFAPYEEDPNSVFMRLTLAAD